MSRGWTLGVASVAGYLLVLDLIGVNVALPDMRRDLGASLAQVQWAVDAYAVALAALLLTAGALADRVGRRRVFLGGLAVFTVASPACALASSALALDLFRVVQGAGAALLYGATAPLVAAAYPAGRERNRALGVFAAASGAAIATGPLVCGALTGAAGWRAIFFLNVPLGLAALVVGARTLRESRDPDPRPLDLAATAYLGAGLAALMWALIEGPQAGWGSPLVLGPLVVAGVAFAGLRRARSPMLDLSLLRDRLYAANVAAAFAGHAAGAGSLAYLGLFVQGPMGASPAEAGAWFLAFSLPALGVPLLLARAAHRFSPVGLVAAGPLLLAVSCALMAAAHGTHEWAALVPGLVVGGLASGVGNLVAGQIALAAAPAERAGVAAGITNTAKQLGIAVGVAVLGIPYGLRGVGAMLVVAAAIAVAGALPSLAAVSRRDGRPGPPGPRPAGRAVPGSGRCRPRPDPDG
ncbi:MFS transporter [Spirillospora sp. CA-294931]|uniref:MFS transporter n=1 Tax=Spirillospora sp. CA-294931 TaxID=3240042 RepID=UPI003D89F040